MSAKSYVLVVQEYECSPSYHHYDTLAELCKDIVKYSLDGEHYTFKESSVEIRQYIEPTSEELEMIKGAIEKVRLRQERKRKARLRLHDFKCRKRQQILSKLNLSKEELEILNDERLQLD